VSDRISIVLPCFNEAARISSSLATLDGWFPGDAEIIVVDDGSRDQTFEQAQAYARVHPHVHVVRHDENRGKGAAIATAIPLATADRVVLMDADLAFSRQSVETVLTSLHTADVAVGNRRHHQSRYSVPVRLFGFLYRRHLVGLAFNALVRRLFGLRLRDTQCGLKGFRLDALQKIGRDLTIDGFAVDVELLLIARGLDLRLVDVPVEVTYQTALSSVRLVRNAVAVLADLVRIAARQALGRYSPAAVQGASATQPLTRSNQSPRESDRPRGGAA